MLPFRSDEAARIGSEKAKRDLVMRVRYESESHRESCARAVKDIIAECGNVVDAYPAWHPLVFAHNQPIGTELIPSELCGYSGLGHAIYFANGFITCPFSDGADVIDSVSKLPPHPNAKVLAERLDVKLYNKNTTTVVVKCCWSQPLSDDGRIPTPIAVRLLLERMIPLSRRSDIPLTWDSIRLELLGSPHGRRSSLFVNEDTGQTIKKLWETLIDAGIFV